MGNICGCLLAVVRSVPICGGWCDMTQSPETSCMRQFSNENSVPKPCLWQEGCRTWWESCACGRLCGRVGIPLAGRHRCPIMFFAFMVSFVSWIFIIGSALAFSTNIDVVRRFSWARGSVEASLFTAEVDVGIRSVVVTLTAKPPFQFPEHVSTVRSFDWSDDSQGCDSYDTAKATDACKSCEDAASSVMIWVLMSIITQTVQLATDLQRTTPYGDVNCQKIVGLVTGLYGFISGLRSAHSFASGCWSAQPDSITIPEYPAVGSLDMSWGWGPGWGLIFIATALKAFDVLCHLIVPTPSPKHRKPPDGLGALPNYCSMGPLDAPTRFGYPVKDLPPEVDTEQGTSTVVYQSHI